MTIICHVCAEFHNAKGEKVFSVSRNQLDGMIFDVPEVIREDPLFQMLVDDGSLQAVVSAAEKKQAENNPKLGITTEGKAMKPDKPEAAANANTAEKPDKAAKADKAPAGK